MHPRPCFLLLHIIAHLHLAVNAAAADALLTFKSSLDRSDRLPWRPDTAPAFCASWPGVRQCAPAGRVTKLVLDVLNLTGSLTAALLAPLAELQVLSLKSNALTGLIPEALPRASLAALPRLTSLLLDRNLLTGAVPLLAQRTLRALNVSANRLSGEIPRSLAARFNASSFLPNLDPSTISCRTGHGSRPPSLLL
jgi:hypothetical protein